MNTHIHFTHGDYQRLRETLRLWWAGEWHRPIAPIITTGHDSDRAPSPFPALSFSTAWDFSVTPEQLVDAQDAFLSTCRFHGEAYPHMGMDAFGPGTLAAFLGCTPVGAKDTVWFRPPQKDIELSDLHFEPDESNPYFRRVMNVYEAALEKWGDRVVLGMVDMGGILDVLAHFRGSENLLCDLIDEPEEVLRCVREIQAMWFHYYDRINDFLRPHVPGYTQWFNLYGEEPSYILQSDFSYMISPDMFRTFVAPELASSAARIPHAIYHMDGVGEIPHLDQLLAIDAIEAIQWVPGEGVASHQNWDELLSRILASGKKLMHWNQLPDGTPTPLAKDPGQLCLNTRWFRKDQWDAAQRYAEKVSVTLRQD